MTESAKPTGVVGDGWAALATVGMLATKGELVHWIAGAGSRVLSPLPALESSTDSYGAVEMLVELCNRLGIELGPERTGAFLREFKNKAFRTPSWMTPEELPERKQSREESLWDPERSIANCFETRFDLSLAEIEEEIRARLSQPEFANIRRIEGNPLAEIRAESGKVKTAVLASGQEIDCEQVIYADRWSTLGKVRGLPKSLDFTRRRDPHGVLQTSFTHHAPFAVGVLEGFFSAMNREAGEEFDRRVWGYFSSDGMKSHWTVCFSSDESEDNHEIAKKLRRMKQTLEKMFAGSEWSKGGFLANIRDEQVRFEENFLFGSGERPVERIRVSSLEGISFLTDGYGPSSSFHQVKLLLEPELSCSQAQRQDVADTASP